MKRNKARNILRKRIKEAQEMLDLLADGMDEQVVCGVLWQVDEEEKALLEFRQCLGKMEASVEHNILSTMVLMHSTEEEMAMLPKATQRKLEKFRRKQAGQAQPKK